jgi:polysaccharide biosynthesis protein PslH
MKPELLFLSAHLPVENSRQAGNKIIWHNLRRLGEKYSVHLLSFRSPTYGDELLGPLGELCAEVEVFDMNWPKRIQAALRSPGLPLLVAARSHARVTAAITRHVTNGRLRRVHCEFAQMAQYVPLALAVAERTLTLHDVASQWAERRSQRTGVQGWFWRWEARRLREWEKRHYRLFTRVYTLCGKDRELVGKLSPEFEGRTVILPPAIRVYDSLARRDFYSKTPQLLFWGALDRIENATAARWLLKELAPRLQIAFPSATLMLAGANPPRDLTASPPANVKVPGFVPDPTELFANSQMAVLPLFEGAGVKIKVLESLAAGLPVLTTEIGAEGIDATMADGLEVLPARVDSFLHRIGELLLDRARLAQLGTAAHRWNVRQNGNPRLTLLEGGCP